MAEAGMLNVGDIFGEESLHDQAPYKFDVIAQGSASFLVISRDSIEQLCGPIVDIVARSAGGAASNTDLQKEIASMAERLTIEDPAEDYSESEIAPPRTAFRPRRESVFVEAVHVDEKWVPPSYPHTPEDVSRLRGYVAKTVLLSHLSTHLRDTVIDALERKEYPKGAEIIKQGASGDYYYILDSGRADVWQAKIGGPETKVFEYSSGGAFGELALLHGERRHASVRATDDCVCWALDRNTFRKIMMSTGRHTMEERTAFISRIKLLENLSTFERFRIAEAMGVLECIDGSRIVARGSPATAVFILQRGRCERRAG